MRGDIPRVLPPIGPDQIAPAADSRSSGSRSQAGSLPMERPLSWAQLSCLSPPERVENAGYGQTPPAYPAADQTGPALERSAVARAAAGAGGILQAARGQAGAGD